jgi:hypothetical protein
MRDGVQSFTHILNIDKEKERDRVYGKMKI